MESKKKTQSLHGYSFPAEWEQHDGIFLAWPHDVLTFPSLEKVEKAYVKMIQALQESEDVHLFVTGKQMRKKVENLLSQSGIDFAKIIFYEHDYADVWFRDYGPTFVINKKEKKKAMVKWTFNSWGNKYPELLKDNDVPYIINKKMKLPLFEAGIIGEGGAIETNGQGTLLTTTSCLLNKNRNPGKSKNEIESVLKKFLRQSNVIWLEHGIKGDDTDGHIDNLARFVNPSTILCSYADKNDENFTGLKKNFEKLSSEKDQDGKKMKLVKLPLPTFFDAKKRLSASYANFYIANKAVLVPQFNLKTDKEAIEIIASFFPTRKIVGIDCTDVVIGYGTLHCISQQMPRV